VGSPLASVLSNHENISPPRFLKSLARHHSLQQLSLSSPEHTNLDIITTTHIPYPQLEMSSSSQCPTNTAIFLDGWLTLPDELKLRIVSFALPSDRVLAALALNPPLQKQLPSSVAEIWRRKFLEMFQLFESEVLPLLACSEIAGMVNEVFYKQNTVSIRYNHSFGNVY
jgi:hypothetical protein